MKINIEEMTDEELVELIIELLDSPRAFQLLAKIPLYEKQSKTGFAQLLQKEFQK